MRTLTGRLLVAALALALCLASLASADDPATGLKAEYFANETLSGPPAAERVDPRIDFAWEGVEPAAGVPSHRFSIRWSGTIQPRYSERYTLTTRTDDGVRLWVDGRLLIDDWRAHAVKANAAQVDLVAGRRHAIVLEFYEHFGRAEARLQWQSASQRQEIVPSDRLAPPSRDAVDAPGDGREDAPLTSATGDVTADADDPAPVLPPPAPPIAGERFNAAPEEGEILVRRPEDGELVPLQEGASLPVGTRIDARDGTVSVQTAPAEGVDRPTQDADFRGAMFRVGQPSRGARIVTLDLNHGDFESCRGESPEPRRVSVRASARKRPGRVVRELFGKGKGRFRTKGRFAAATVRGTEWTIADRCHETVTRVTEGAVDVENLVTGRTVRVEAGERYAVRRPRR